MQPEDPRRAACCELVSEVARDSGEVSLRLSGTSMLPAMWPGDLITVRPCPLEDLRPGQVLLYRANGNLVAHRILHIAGDRLITRGDSVPQCDAPLHASDIVGPVIAILREGRQIDPAYTLRRRILSTLIRRSHLCFRILLRLGTSASESVPTPIIRTPEPL